jgi:hypothetical protein
MNLYEIGVRMTMTHNVSPILTTLAHQFMHLHQHINQATAASTRFRAAIGGTISAFAGVQLGQGVGHMLVAGNHLVKVQNQMTAAGWKHKDLAEAAAKSWEITAKYQSIGAAEVLEMQKEMAPVLGDRHHAVGMAEQMAKLHMSLQGTLGFDSASQFNKQIRDAIRAGELSANVLQPERFAHYLDGMAKTLKAFGGTITPTDYFMATKYGRASAMNWDDKFTQTTLPTIMQELGASTTGTSLMTLYQAVVGGRLKGKNIAAFDKLGLIDHSKLDPANLTAEGRIKSMMPGALAGSRMLMENPFEWSQQYLVPALLKKGILGEKGWEAIKRGDIKDGDGKEARKAVSEYMAQLFGDRTAQGLADILVLQYKKIMRDAHMVPEAMGLDEGVGFYNAKSYEMAGHKIGTQWENLMTAFGSPGVELATRAMNVMASGLNVISQWVSAHPTFAKVFLATMSGLAAGLVLIGSVVLAVAAFGALGAVAGIGVILLGLAGGLAALAAINWKSIREFFTGRGEYVDKNGGYHARVKSLGEKVQGIYVQFVNTLMSIPSQIASAITAMASTIAAKLRDALGWIGRVFSNPNAGGNSSPKAIQPQSFVPPASSGGGPRVMRTTLVIDGRVLGEAAASWIARQSQHMGGSADFDGMQASMPVDYSPA